MFTNPGEFAESVTIYPGTGEPYAINAQVFRSAPQELLPQLRLLQVEWEIILLVSIDSVQGIAPMALDLGTFRVDVAAKAGDEPGNRQILGSFKGDAGMMWLLVE